MPLIQYTDENLQQRLINTDIITIVGKATDDPSKLIINTNAMVPTEQGLVPLRVISSNSMEQFQARYNKAVRGDE